MFNLSINRRATLPYELPILVTAKLLKSVLKLVTIRDRFESNLRSARIPLLESTLKPRKVPYQIRISNTLYNGALQY